MNRMHTNAAANTPPPGSWCEGALYYRVTDDGRCITIYKMAFTWKLCVGDDGSPYIDDAFCYPTRASAEAAAAVWSGDGDPLDGWTRHPSSGRRRMPDGDPATEVVRP